MFGKNKTEWKFALGIKVRDKVSGFVGVIDSRTEWLNGCKRYSVQPPVDKDGKHLNGLYIDEQQIEVITEEKVKVQQSATGGPTSSDPVEHSIPPAT